MKGEGGSRSAWGVAHRGWGGWHVLRQEGSALGIDRGCMCTSAVQHRQDSLAGVLQAIPTDLQPRQGAGGCM